MTEIASDTRESDSIFDIPRDDEPTPHTNGQGGNKGEGEEEHPNKRRRISEAATNSPKSRPKPSSPPWKKVIAEGPTSFTVDGKRKSGRTNQVPFELQPPSDKRQTRGAVQKTSSVKGKRASINGSSSFQSRDGQPPSSSGFRKTGLSPTQQPQKPVAAAPSPKRPYHRRSMPTEQTTTPVRPYNKKASSASKPPKSGRGPGRPRRVVEASEAPQPEEVVKDALEVEPSPKTKPRIKFRVKPAELPFIHPSLVIKKSPLYGNLKEYLDNAGDVPVAEGGLWTAEDPNEYDQETIAKDARVILRLEEAARPGGVLSPEACSIYQPDEQDRPPPSYAHLDHMTRAAVEFRRLMLIEQRKHRASAKRLAEACREEWYRRQPKSEEQIEVEQIRSSQARYRHLVKILQATWDNVRAEINRRRVVEWEAQEQIRVRKALNEAVDISTQKLEARRAQLDFEASSDEDEDELADGLDEADSIVSTAEDGESNMSESEDDAEDDAEQLQPGTADDENLSLEQLREKYATLPSLPEKVAPDDTDDPSEAGVAYEDTVEASQPDDTFDDSDESVDMDDDMGSSDEERNSDEESSRGEDEQDDEGEDESSTAELGTLGFLPAVDIQSLAAEQDVTVVEQDELEDESSNIASGMKLAHTEASETTETSKLPGSPDQSSQPTPVTLETRPSEADSASSVDPNQTSRQVSHSQTPQPTDKMRTPVPFLLRGTLREYQHDGLDWLSKLYAQNTNGILADEMGLGKTIQSISLLAHLACDHEVWGPHLVIVPTSVMLNWEMEFKKFLPGFKILTYYGTQEERKRKRLGWKSDDAWNVIITSYQLVLQDQNVFKRRRWHYMILDEAHNIKNFQSQRWQVMLTFNTRARLLLTGTPLQNNLTELWSLLFFLMPSDGTEQGVGGFANLKEFQDWFKKPSEQILEHGREVMDDESRLIISKLHQVLRPYLLRRLKADVEKQMPAKYEHVEFCRLSKRQRELYDGFLNREDTRGTLASGNYLSIINCLMQLKKVCNHPDLFVDRPIMTSFPMEKSVIADFEIKDLLVRRRLLHEDPMTKVSLEFLNLVPIKHEHISDSVSARIHMLSAQKKLMDLREFQRCRAMNTQAPLDPSTTRSNLIHLEGASRWGRFEELQHCVYLNALRRQQNPIYGSRLTELLTLGVNERPLLPKPRRRDQMLLWLEDSSPTLKAMVPTLSLRSEALKPTIQKFACVTPSVVARDMTALTFTPKVVKKFQEIADPSQIDPFHEARMKLSIQFPDKRLLQYDCGKLQTLAKLLRRLQAGGHRALIFTQMTKVLDILEQFLNIHGHKYLRLDGSTKIEQRQILTDRFNSDNRILAFILSSRSGGLGINLTGADTVIFYDLDWNPAMDKQCQDRCHRIGQTRDVHIYRLVSEHTIEANILRKSNQKRMLDDVVIQEGDFTTDYFNKTTVADALDPDDPLLDGDAAANAAVDRVLGGGDGTKDVSHVLAQAEDQEDVMAARVAEREVVQTLDAADFEENAVVTPVTLGTSADGLPVVAGETPAVDDLMDVDEEEELNAWGQKILSTDDYMLKLMAEQLKDAPLDLPKGKVQSKKGKDHRNRSHRVR